jgi:sulfatase modifying factor 1
LLKLFRRTKFALPPLRQCHGALDARVHCTLKRQSTDIARTCAILLLATLVGAALVGCWSRARAAAPGVDAAAPQRSGGRSAVPNGAAIPAGMLRIPAGFVVLGSTQGTADERPTGERMPVAAFWMDRTEVSNAQFAAFVQASGYVTDAERQGAAAVFRAPAKGRQSRRGGDWWSWVAGANWRRPNGPGGGTAVPDQPVVLVTLRDAYAYAAWLGRDLPTEAQWEYAARAGGRAERLGRPLGNFWQGIFPDMNTGDDGYVALAPVCSFPANGFGLCDMLGNAWELTKDAYTGPHLPHGNGEPAAVRPKASAGASVVIKGGSFLCADNYCSSYRSTSRQAHEADMPTSHVGFRTVLRDRAVLPNRDNKRNHEKEV